MTQDARTLDKGEWHPLQKGLGRVIGYQKSVCVYQTFFLHTLAVSHTNVMLCFFSVVYTMVHISSKPPIAYELRATWEDVFYGLDIFCPLFLLVYCCAAVPPCRVV